MIFTFGHLCTEFHTRLSEPLKAGDPHIAENGTAISGGNALNIAIAAARSGAKVSVGGTIGTDLFAERIITTLRREGIQLPALAQRETPTGFVQIITDKDGQKTSVASIGANEYTAHSQIAQRMLNERTLLVLQNDLPAHVNIKLLDRAKKSGAHTMMCLMHDQNIEKELFEHYDFIIGNNKKATLTPPNTDTATLASFCGTFAACIQAGLSPEQAEEYAKAASTLTEQAKQPNSFPYLGDIEDSLKVKSRA